MLVAYVSGENNASQSDHNFYLHGGFAYCEGHLRNSPCLFNFREPTGALILIKISID